jgi:glutamate-1-semialdehyde 2,1-aminomutase
METKFPHKRIKTTKSQKLFLRAMRLIPGGVNSPSRAFKAVNRTPIFMKKGSGSFVWDEDRNKYIDYNCSNGSLLLGHANPTIIKAVRKAAASGTSYDACTKLEVQMAKIITKLVPSVEMVRFVNSGTEAAMTAVRLARAFTGRNKIIIFEGCNHGHADAFLVNAATENNLIGVPASDGVPDSIVADTLIAQFNNINSVRNFFEKYPDDIAAVIIEPVATSMGCIPPLPGFLESVRTLCTLNHSLLIFDEGTTGFRIDLGSAQGEYNINPDITILGKIIGGGLPIGAYGGKQNIMELMAPSGSVYQAGTFSGNPLSLAAGYQTLRILSTNKMIYKHLEDCAEQLEDGIRDILEQADIPHIINRVGSMFTVFFTDSQVTDYRSALNSDTELYKQFFNALLNEGIYFPPSQLGTAFLSTAHTDAITEKTLRAFRRAVNLYL